MSVLHRSYPCSDYPEARQRPDKMILVGELGMQMPGDLVTLFWCKPEDEEIAKREYAEIREKKQKTVARYYSHLWV